MASLKQVKVEVSTAIALQLLELHDTQVHGLTNKTEKLFCGAQSSTWR